MVQALLSGRGDVVYGSRYTSGFSAASTREQSWPAYLGGRSLSIAALI